MILAIIISSQFWFLMEMFGKKFFDYYDTVEMFPLPNDEVDKYGRSLRTRIHPLSGNTDKNYKYYKVPPGNYKVVLSIDGINQNKIVSIL